MFPYKTHLEKYDNNFIVESVVCNHTDCIKAEKCKYASRIITSASAISLKNNRADT